MYGTEEVLDWQKSIFWTAGYVCNTSILFYFYEILKRSKTSRILHHACSQQNESPQWSLPRTQKAVTNWNLTVYMFTLKILSFVKSLFNEKILKPETRSTGK